MNYLQFWNTVDVPMDPSACWNWTGPVNYKGYGRPWMKGKNTYAHRIAYEQFAGPLGGLTVDHLCRNRKCQNPRHMEAVTSVVNSMRGECIGTLNKRKTHCPSGHEYTPENIRRVPSHPGARYCRKCHNIETVASRRRKRGGGG